MKYELNNEDRGGLSSSTHQAPSERFHQSGAHPIRAKLSSLTGTFTEQSIYILFQMHVKVNSSFYSSEQTIFNINAHFICSKLGLDDKKIISIY